MILELRLGLSLRCFTILSGVGEGAAELSHLADVSMDSEAKPLKRKGHGQAWVFGPKLFHLIPGFKMHFSTVLGIYTSDHQLNFQ